MKAEKTITVSVQFTTEEIEGIAREIRSVCLQNKVADEKVAHLRSLLMILEIAAPKMDARPVDTTA